MSKKTLFIFSKCWKYDLFNVDVMLAEYLERAHRLQYIDPVFKNISDYFKQESILFILDRIFFDHNRASHIGQNEWTLDFGHDTSWEDDIAAQYFNEAMDEHFDELESLVVYDLSTEQRIEQLHEEVTEMSEMYAVIHSYLYIKLIRNRILQQVCHGQPSFVKVKDLNQEDFVVEVRP